MEIEENLVLGSSNNHSTPVIMVVSRELVKAISLIDRVGQRQIMVQSLIQSYDLVGPGLRLVAPRPLTTDQLAIFHSRDYLDFLANPQPELEEEFGLGYDCPPLDEDGGGMITWARTVAGGSVAAAGCLARGETRLAVNWAGGWHHAHRDRAAGFCYVNDVVLAVHRLQKTFKRVMYVDLDIHHGDGVEEAFSATDRVVTLSIHKYEAGYFPGTGGVDEVGTGKGRGYCFNMPFEEGVTDDMYTDSFVQVFQPLVARFQPHSIVVQCGADCLAGDPMGGFNLTETSIRRCVLEVVDTGLPVLLLGGGGYHPANAARLWTVLTAAVLDRTQDLDLDIPDCDPFFTRYGPDFQVTVSRGCARNKNNPLKVQKMVEQIRKRIGEMKVET